MLEVILMKSKELRRLSKIELLTMLRDQEEEIGQLKKQILQLENQLNEKSIRIEKYGSIAEAALELNRIFEIAQQAADQYVCSVKKLKSEDPYFGLEEYQNQQESYFQEVYQELKKRADKEIEIYKQKEYKKINSECELYKKQILMSHSDISKNDLVLQKTIEDPIRISEENIISNVENDEFSIEYINTLIKKYTEENND